MKTFKDLINLGEEFDKAEYDNYLKLSKAIEEFNEFYNENKKYIKDTFPGYDPKSNIQYTSKQGLLATRKELIRFTKNSKVKTKRYELGGNQ
jgi:hypothetical protein